MDDHEKKVYLLLPALLGAERRCAIAGMGYAELAETIFAFDLSASER